MSQKIHLHIYYTSFKIVCILCWTQTTFVIRLKYILIEFVTFFLNTWKFIQESILDVSLLAFRASKYICLVSVIGFIYIFLLRTLQQNLQLTFNSFDWHLFLCLHLPLFHVSYHTFNHTLHCSADDEWPGCRRPEWALAETTRMPHFQYLSRKIHYSN